MNQAEKQAYSREYYSNHKDYFRNYAKLYYSKNKASLKLYMRKYHKNLRNSKRKIALKLIGDKCFICETVHNICFHERHGKRHKSSSEDNFAYILKHSQDFVPICNKHHRMVHELAKNLKLDPECQNKALELAKELMG